MPASALKVHPLIDYSKVRRVLNSYNECEQVRKKMRRRFVFSACIPEPTTGVTFLVAWEK